MTRRLPAAIGLGSNLGDKAARIREALAALDDLTDTTVTRVSRLYRTSPVGPQDQDWFVNAAALLETGLDPGTLMAGLLEIEARLGRIRTRKWGPRTIDLDILFYDQLVRVETDLTLPHPCLAERRFVLVPLDEVAPNWIHPLLGLTPGRMLAGLRAPDQELEAL